MLAGRTEHGVGFTASGHLRAGLFDPGNTGCVHATFSNGVLHLEKNCPTSTNAAAGAPRFDIQTTTGFFFLGCNNVIPVGNTYAFDAATIAAAGNQVPVPTGDIVSISVLIDVEGIADLTNITVNGQTQVPATPMSANDCKNGGWQTFVLPAFKNHGDCVSWVATNGRNAPAGYPLLKSTISREGDVAVVTRNGTLASRPIAQLRTASKSPVRTTSLTTEAPGRRFGPL
jgi:hypothetical protein